MRPIVSPEPSDVGGLQHLPQRLPLGVSADDVSECLVMEAAASPLPSARILVATPKTH